MISPLLSGPDSPTGRAAWLRNFAPFDWIASSRAHSIAAVTASLLLVAFASITEYVVVARTSGEQEASSAVLNYSGRQRMLLTRTALLAEWLVYESDVRSPADTRSQMLAAVQELEEIHDGLLKGNVHLNLPGQLPSDIAHLFFSEGGIDEQVRQVIDDARSLAVLDRREIHPDIPSFQRLEAAATGELMEGLEETMRRYQAHATAAAHDRLRLRGWLLALTLTLLSLAGLLALCPACLRGDVRFLEGQRQVLSRSVRVAKGLLLERRVTRRLRTDLGRADERLSLLHSIQESLVEGLVVASPNGDAPLLNPAAKRLLGSGSAEVPLESWPKDQGFFEADGTTPCHPSRFPLGLATHGINSGLQTYFLRNATHPQGRWISTTATSVRRRDGSLAGAVLVMRDITERKTTADRLRDSEQHLRAILNRLPVILWTTDNDLRITTALGNGLEPFGLTAEGATGKYLGEVFGVSDPDFRPIQAQREAVSGTASSYPFLWKKRTYRVSVEPMDDENGNRCGSVGIALDLTDTEDAQEECRVARRIQAHLLPREIHGFAGLEIGGETVPATSAAGDYFDCIPLPDQALALVVADVTGHGVGPALLMAETRAYLRALARRAGALDDIVGQLNRFLLEDTEETRFVTLLMARIDQKNRLQYISAGHPPGFILDKQGRVKARLESTAVPLGLFSAVDFNPPEPIQLEPGDLVALLTDGISEALDIKERPYRDEGALTYLASHRSRPAKAIATGLCRHVRRYCGHANPQDDITAMVAKVNGARRPT